MAITHKEAGEKTVTLEVTNGDRDKLEQVLRDWNFKDYQSLIRFSLSALILTADKSLWIKDSEGNQQGIAPSDHLLKE